MATWQEFVKAVEAAGVQPDDEIDYIDVSHFNADTLNIKQTEVAGERHFTVTD